METSRFIRLRPTLDGKRPAGERFFAAAGNALDTAGFQTMPDRLMARHLSAIQVLGYFLGAIVGTLQRA